MAWLTGWDHAKKLTIRNNNIDADLTDVTVLCYVNNDADLSDALATGNDIRFTDSNGTTLLKHDRESWSGGNGTNVTAIYWVKMSLTSGTAKEYYIYWGKSDATSGEDKAEAWDSSTVFRSDMADKTTSTINDSVSTTDGDKTAANEPIEATGKIGKGQDFDGTNDLINLGDNSAVEGIDEISISLWFSTNNNSVLQGLVTKGIYNNSTSSFASAHNGTSSRLTFSIKNDRYGWLSWTPTNNQQYHLAFVYSKTSELTNIYIDGVAQTINVGGTFTTIPVTTRDLLIGNQPASGFMSGLLDEVRIANAARSAAWIKFDHAITDAPNTETTWGAKLDAPAIIPIIHYRRQHLAA